jgi:protein phosphatase
LSDGLTAPKFFTGEGETQMSISYVCETNIGQKRSVNEDSFWPPTHQHAHRPDEPYGMLFIVADGMGGHGAGDLASSLAVAEISNHYYSLGEAYNDIGQRLQAAIQEAHQKICWRAAQSPETQDMGATVAAVVVKYDDISRQGEAWIAWAGDSRVYLQRHGRLQQLTRDHSRVWPLIEAGQLTWDELRFHPDRSRVTNALTARRADVVAEALYSELKPGDQLLICSDGLSGEVRPEEMAQLLKAYPPAQAVQRLIEKANAPKEFNRNGQTIRLEGGNDNITSILITIPGNETQTAVMTSPPTPVAPAVTPPSPRIGLAIISVLVLLLLVGAGLFFVFSGWGNLAVVTQVPAAASPSPVETTADESNPVVIAVETEATPTLQPEPASPEAPLAAVETRQATVTRGPTASPTSPATATSIPATLPAATATLPITAPLITLLTNLPEPILLQPEADETGKTQYDTRRELTFVWQWPGQLTDDLSFEIRVWLRNAQPVGAHDAALLRQNPTFKHADSTYSVALVLKGASGIPYTSSDYLWSVGVVRIQPAYEWLGIESETRPMSLVVPEAGSGSGDSSVK